MARYTQLGNVSRQLSYFWLMLTLQHITIIGNGKVGQFMERNLSSRFQVTLVSRDGKTGHAFPQALADLIHKTSLVLLCVSDQAIKEVSEQIPHGKIRIVHVSGATPLEALSDKHPHRGIWYPLMSFTPDQYPDIKSIPFCLEATDEDTFKLLKELTLAVGARFHKVDSEQRKVVHLAAVLAQNFSNHLYELAFEEMKKAHLDFDLLKPLLLQSINRLNYNSPADMQTGPAVRKDELTIARHEKMITNPLTLEIYRLMTQSIQQKHDPKL